MQQECRRLGNRRISESRRSFLYLRHGKKFVIEIALNTDKEMIEN